VKRFVYASSVAAYGFHPDNPVPMTEDHPVRPASKLFYAQEKAELEHLLAQESGLHPELDLYLLRPPIVVGPNALGAKELLPGPLQAAGERVASALMKLPLPLPALAPDIPLQLIHEADVGQAFLQCVVGAGPPGAYNIAGDGVITGADVWRELGLAPVRVPAKVVQTAARAASAVPFLPPQAEWVEAATRPAIMDTSKARRELGFEPVFTALEALRDTIPRG
jgi:nucleoside-diphosphate-sugar epimerase